MNLREFYTNSSELRDQIEPEDRGKSLSTKVLGVQWNLQDDTFVCGGLKSTLNSDRAVVTKRTIVREVAQVFDPCGWFAPVVVLAKLLVQELWREGVAWDDPVSEETKRRWQVIRENLESVPTLSIPRYVCGTEARFQLHVFCDASQKAAAAVVILRTSMHGSVECHLLMAKKNASHR